MKHPIKIKGFEGNLSGLAKAVGNMRYDKVRDFLEYLADDIKSQADADKQKAEKLAERLYQTAEKLYKARDEMGSVWKICEPYMKPTLDDVYESAGKNLTDKMIAITGEKNIVEWFYEPNKAFDDKSPYDLCNEGNSNELERVVMDILTAAQGG